MKNPNTKAMQIKQKKQKRSLTLTVQPEQIMAKSNMGAVLDFHAEWLLSEIACGLSSENTTQVILIVPEAYKERLAQACSQKIPLACYGRFGGENLLIRHNGQEIYNKPYVELTTRYLRDWGELFADT